MVGRKASTDKSSDIGSPVQIQPAKKSKLWEEGIEPVKTIDAAFPILIFASLQASFVRMT